MEILSEKKRLQLIFGQSIDLHPEIIEIENMLQNGNLIKKEVPIRFFDGLFYVMEKMPSLSSKVKIIDLELLYDSKKSTDYSENIYLLHAVLNRLILYANLYSLK